MMLLLHILMAKIKLASRNSAGSSLMITLPPFSSMFSISHLVLGVERVEGKRWIRVEERKTFKREPPRGIECVFFKEDWYVIVTTQHLIYNKCLTYDERAAKEMNATITLVREAIATKGIKQLILSMQKKED